MTLPDPTITFTIAKSDTAHARFIAGLNAPDAGVVSIRIRPDTRRFGWIAKDVLAATGKREDVSGGGRKVDAGLALVWLLAHDIRHLVVAGVEALNPEFVSELVTLAVTCRIHLWLVADHVAPEPLTDTLEQWPVTPTPQHDFDTHWQEHLAQTRSQHAAERTDDQANWPAHVPSSDFPVFLADVHRHLPAHEAAHIDRAFRTAVSGAVDEFRAAEDLTADQITGLLRAHVSECASLAEATIVARAFQVAAFHTGWFVQIDLETFLASSEHDITATVRNPATWTRLRAYKHPYQGAVCALVAAGVDLSCQRTLTVGDVNSDGTHVTVDGTTITVPDGASVFLQAHTLHRMTEGADRTDSLFADVDGKQFSVRKLARALSDAATDLGIVLYAGQVRRSNPNRRLWRSGHGISIKRLAPPRRGSAA